MKKIIVPEGMEHAVVREVFEQCGRVDYHPQIRVGLEAALLWLSENPIAPTDEQVEELQEYSFNNIHGSKMQLVWSLFEWQRRMFLAPEPEVPEEVKDLLLDENIPTADYSRPTRDYYNTQILEAFRRGQKSGEILQSRERYLELLCRK